MGYPGYPCRASRWIKPPILAFFDFLAFFVFRFSLLFLAFFLPFPRILGVPRREKPCVFGEKPCFFPKKQGLEGQGFRDSEKTFRKVPVRNFEAAWEGLKMFRTRSGSFFGSFCAFFKPFFLSIYWQKLSWGGCKPGGFPLFSGKVQIVSRTLSGLFLVGALDRPRKRKGTNRENPRTIPEHIGKIPEKSGKSQKGQKWTKKEGQVQIGKSPPYSGSLIFFFQGQFRSADVPQ